MIIAQRLQYTHRAEYLLYMWQVEDILRAYSCDIDRIDVEYLTRFADLDDDTRHAMHRWYSDLCDMMRVEAKVKEGHLQICQNVIIGMAELHDALMNSPSFPYYTQLYHRVLPYIVELRSRRGDANHSEEASCTLTGSAVELLTLLEAMYGVMILRLQNREISSETASAQNEISEFIATLSDYWTKYHDGKLEFD